MKDTAVETLPADWETYRIWFHHSDGTSDERLEIVHTPTGVRYAHEPLDRISAKCLLLFLGTQFFGYNYMAWHLVRAPLVAVAIAIQSIWQAIRHPNWEEVTRAFAAVIWTAPLAFLENIWAAIRTPYYVWKIELAGLYGIVKPLQGREKIAEAERDWHHRTRREDIRFYDDVFTHFWKGLIEPRAPSTLFLALCMQPVGVMPEGPLPDPHLNVDRVERVIPAF